MKKVILLLSLICMYAGVSAQSFPRQKEVGISFSGLSHFGFIYRTGHQQAMWRLGSNVVDVGSHTYFSNNGVSNKTENFGLRLSGGREFRKPIADNWEFRYGLDASFGFQHTVCKRLGNENPMYDYSTLEVKYSPGLNAVIGVNYILNKRFVIGAEFLPGANYTFGRYNPNTLPESTTKQQRISGYNLYMNSTSALFTALYRF